MELLLKDSYTIRPCQFVIVKAFYPLLLIVSYKFSVHFQPQKIRRISTSYGCRALLGRLYLFTSYALQCQSAFRYLIDYLGINLLMFKST
nr:MAG TPA: hypothetical protein [Bacteriophage sp.]